MDGVINVETKDKRAITTKYFFIVAAPDLTSTGP
jgi:hypothetical protein